MSVRRVIPSSHVDIRQIESFPYGTAHFTTPLADAPDDNDNPLGASLSTPEEDVRRLASVDQLIFEKLQQAERDALETARRGYEEGFAAGAEEGRKFGEGQYLAHLQQLEGHLRELTRSLALNQASARDEILALALAMGEYLAGREIRDGARRMGPVLEAVLAAHPFPGSQEEGTPPMTVFLHPKDLEALGAEAAAHPGLALREDPELSRGGLRVEAAEGVLDATLERRAAGLEELIQRFRDQEAP